ncbi:MAG: ATP-binding cassette domain-containing protein [Kiritimatiellae bacterium]|nr:ATP-binding cassette domain-containing protein [Kiritimatiellia bacterium]
MSIPALQFSKVTGGYRHVPVFEDLAFSIDPGTLCGVIGPNGCGKTTLIRAATGLLPRLSGSVSLFGKDVVNLKAAERAQRVGVVPQELSTPMAFTVEALVAMGRTHALGRRHTLSADDRRIIEQAMVYTDVMEMRRRPFPELSGGEKQRTVIAMVLAQQPRMILMDEATSHLDINHALEVMQIVERLNREAGVTILTVSHDLNIAAEFCERLLLLDHGRLVADGAPADVLTEERLREVYHCDVRVQSNPVNGSVMVTPSPRLAPGRSGEGIHVHCIAGGGSGEEILRRLHLCDYTVTCGVLNEGDSDSLTATALGIEGTFEQPFSAIGAQTFVEAEAQARQADAVVICPTPFGPGNAVNLDLAARALEQNIPVFLAAGVGDRDYTPDRRATKTAAQLVDQGAREWQSVTDLFTLLGELIPPQDPSTENDADHAS